MLGDDKRKVVREPMSADDIVLILAIGSEMCQKMKEIYPEKSWGKIANIFTDFKTKMRKFYADKNEVEMHKEIRNYSAQDIFDALEV